MTSTCPSCALLRIWGAPRWEQWAVHLGDWRRRIRRRVRSQHPGRPDEADLRDDLDAFIAEESARDPEFAEAYEKAARRAQYVPSIEKRHAEALAVIEAVFSRFRHGGDNWHDPTRRPHMEAMRDFLLEEARRDLVLAGCRCGVMCRPSSDGRRCRRCSATL